MASALVPAELSLGRACLALVVVLAVFCRILGTMLANGVPILQALAISREIGDRQGEGNHLGNLRQSRTSLVISIRTGVITAVPFNINTYMRLGTLQAQARQLNW